MYEWLTSWFEQYNDIKIKWVALPSNLRHQHYQQLEEKAGELLDAWTLLDEHLQQLNDHEETLQPLHYRSHGTTYYELGMYEKAIATLANEKSTGVADEVRQLYLAYATLFTDNYSKSKEQFLYLLNTSRAWIISYFSCVGLGFLYTQTEQVDEAIHFFERAKQITPTADVMYNLGICFFVEEQFSMAKHYFEHYVAAIPDDSEAMFYLGCCLMDEGEVDEAWSYWLASIQMVHSQETLLALANVCEWLGNHEMAIQCYKQFQQNDVEVFHGLAWNYALLEQKEQAIMLFEQALALDPTNRNVLTSLTWLHRHWPEGKWLQLMQGSH